VLNKETKAYLGANSVVNAQAKGAAIGNAVPDGTFVSDRYHLHPTFSGLAVDSNSSEDVFGLAPAVAGGFVGVAGGVGVTVMYITTEAFIGPNSQINLASGADASQSVNVSAVDYFKSLTIAGGIAGGAVAVAGGVDVGVADTSAQARIGQGSTVHAKKDVEVFGLSRKEVQTYALSIAGGFVGVAIAVSVWSVGTQANSDYQDSGGAGPDKGTWAANVEYHAGDVVTDSFDNKRYTARCDITPNENWRAVDDNGDAVTYNECRVVKDSFDNKLYQADRPSSGRRRTRAPTGTSTRRWRRTPTRTGRRRARTTTRRSAPRRPGTLRPTRSTRRARRTRRTTTRARRTASAART
jgi:hypothetical protein